MHTEEGYVADRRGKGISSSRDTGLGPFLLPLHKFTFDISGCHDGEY